MIRLLFNRLHFRECEPLSGGEPDKDKWVVRGGGREDVIWVCFHLITSMVFFPETNGRFASCLISVGG